MAPARSGKRQATGHVEEPPHKKVAPLLKKHGVTQAIFKQMVEVLQHPLASHLTEDCKEMILAMLPHSLCVPSDLREDVQNSAVKMFEEVVASVEANLKEALEAEKGKVKTIIDSKEQLLSEVSKAQEQLKDAEKDLEEKNHELTASSQAVVAAKTSLSKKEEEQKTGDASLLQTEADKAELQKAFEGVFLMVEAGESTDSAAQLKVFESAMKKLTMEDSLKMAILPVLQKPPAERGGFDATVISEFQSIFEAKLRDLSEMLQQGAPERQARQLCVDQARAQLEEAETKQKATSALKEVEASVASYEATLKAAMDVQDEKQKDLDGFVETTMKGFTNLKERVSVKRQKELAAEAKAKAIEADAEAKAAAAAAEGAEGAAEDAEPREVAVLAGA
mmetsp:Transcript_87998/g.139840  ORF Transcript_87998/g.139840 Transcript_87998/m.139840 type:complete len:393 (+) Transcript_87998:60-1238(+)